MELARGRVVVGDGCGRAREMRRHGQMWYSGWLETGSLMDQWQLLENKFGRDWVLASARMAKYQSFCSTTKDC